MEWRVTRGVPGNGAETEVGAMKSRGLIGLAIGVVAAVVVLGTAAALTGNRTSGSSEGSPGMQKEYVKVGTQTAVFGGGCFWGVELRFSQIEGVVDTEAGFMGGTTDHPSYKDVCAKDTGHAEVVKVMYDPKVVSYDQLLDVFWHVHDPTQVNRQGPDYGTQYRTVIFYTDSAQKTAAEKSKAALQKSELFKETFGDQQIATQIIAAGPFWPAEEYHQDYFLKSGQETCHVGW